MNKKYILIILVLVLIMVSLFRGFLNAQGVPVEQIAIGILVVLTLISIYLVYMKWANWFAPKAPPRNQAWLMDLRISYHPTSLQADVQVPTSTEVFTEVLSEKGEIVLMWEMESFDTGNFTLERPLEGLSEGRYAFRIGTSEQSTLRAFELKK